MRWFISISRKKKPAIFLSSSQCRNAYQSYLTFHILQNKLYVDGHGKPSRPKYQSLPQANKEKLSIFLFYVFNLLLSHRSQILHSVMPSLGGTTRLPKQLYGKQF